MPDDHIAIQQVLNRYTLAACRADWDAVLATFVEDGVWQAPGLGIAARGHAAIRASLCIFVDRMDYFLQINSPAMIDPREQFATATCAIREYGRFTDGGPVEVFGLYDDHLVRTASGWRFACRSFTLLGREGVLPQ